MIDKEVDPFRFNNPIYVLCEGPADVCLVTRLLQREDLDGFSVNYAKGYGRFTQHVRALRTSSDWRRLRRLLIIGPGDRESTQGARGDPCSDAAASRLPGARPFSRILGLPCE